ncbi:hypothetical protein Aduo_016416 [Ancylostoma duodenale]
MKELIVFAAFIAVTTAMLCNGVIGSWSFAIASGVTDFAHGRVEINERFNCFDGCLATGAAFQNFKVALMNSSSSYKQREFDAKADRLGQLMKMKDDDDDPNAITCADPQLRAEIRGILYNAVSCKRVVEALLSNKNRQGWAVNCVSYEDSGSDHVYEDMNFCAYIAFMPPYIIDIRLAKIDST